MIESGQVVSTQKRFDWRVVFWILFVFFLVADQLIKLWARHSLAINSHTLWPNVLDLTLTYNRGIAFGMFQNFGVFLAPIAVGIAAGAILYSISHRKESGWIHIAMSLLAAGALGNLLDRLVFGKVTDMFQVRFIEFPIFNLADSCITVAACMLILKWGAEWVAESRKPKSTAESQAPSPDTQKSSLES